MLVTRSNFADVLDRLKQPGTYALDTETTGLSPYKGDRLFSIIVAQLTGELEEAWYFNFNDQEGVPDDHVLDHTHKIILQAEVFGRADHAWDLHNAKFDLHMLGVDGLDLVGAVYCTYGHGRLLHNDLRYYNLDALAKRWLKSEKSDAVKEYADKHKLYEEITKGKVKRKNYQFARVPLPVIQDYAEKDGTLTARLANFERAQITQLDADRTPEILVLPPLQQVSDNETALTKVLYEIERVGIQLNKDYAQRALEAENAKCRAATAAFLELTGFPFEDSPTCVAKAFKQCAIVTPTGKSGRMLANKGVLASIKHPVVDAIQAYRTAHKKGTTYYANFVAMCDEHGVIHPDFHQGGTKTGRLSCRDPNVQNLNRPDEAADDEDNVFEVRRCFIPRPEFCFFAPDYSQIEYRLMLEYAEEFDVIEQVNAGKDVHSATAEILGVSRFRAKTINFMLIYGGGIDKLASALDLSWSDAKAEREAYFRKLPKISRFIEQVRERASRRLVMRNWFGRRYTFESPDMTYTTAPNWLIQGGCADILKLSLIACYAYLKERKLLSRIVLNVHDEIVFEMHRTEFDHCLPLCDIMESRYPFKYLKLTVDPAFSWKSLADKEKGMPSELPS